MSVQRFGPLADELQRLAAGYFTQPVRWGKRWVFVQLADQRPSGVLKPFAEIRNEIRTRYFVDIRESVIDSLLMVLQKRMVDKGKYVIYDISNLNVEAKTPKKSESITLPRSVPVPLIDDTTSGNGIEDLFRDMEKSGKNINTKER